MKEKEFRFRGFLSLIMFFSFIFMTITGIVLYFAPQGRIAYWTFWKFFGISREIWINLHTVSWFLFLVVAIFHIIYNWKPIKKYFTIKSKKYLSYKKEFIFASLLSLFVILSGFLSIPPFGFLIDLSDKLKNIWVLNKDYEPPFGHAEELSLKAFVNRLNIDLKSAIEEIKRNNLKFESEKETLKDIA